MIKKYKLVIADDEEYICGMLKKIIKLEELGIELVGTAYDGAELLNLIEEMKPDIVITDICMPHIDGLEVIRLAKEKGYNCKFIINSGYRHFDYAYNALKYEVEDYILKPVDANELNITLKKICDNLCNDFPEAIHEKNREALRNYFLIKTINNKWSRIPQSLEEINSKYATNFTQGYFRMIFLKLDYAKSVRNVNEDASSMLKKLKNLIYKQFSDICNDILLEDKPDGVLALLNYEAGKDVKIIDGIYNLFTLSNNVIELFKGLNLTLCVSGTVTDPCKAEILKDQCRLCEWVRMTVGINKVIFSDGLASENLNFAYKKLDELELRMKYAFEAVDIEAFLICINEFFSFPPTALCQMKSMLFMRRIKEMFFKMNEEFISEYTDSDMVWKNLNVTLHQSLSFRQYKEAFIEIITSVMRQAAENIKNKNAKPIRQVYEYVERHFAEQINLDNISNEVNLSSVYFSNYFKKETGKTFTEYLTEYRMKVARDLLVKSDKNINEVAYAVGLSDARYFSKLFKKTVGIKPTDYRKIYG